jgi:hypothetical protein
MTNYNDGKIHGWNGGDCPVHPETEVRAWRRNLGLPILWQAKLISWRHDYGDADIIAFQVVKQHVEPKVIWVNETKGGGLVTFTSKEAALRYVSPHDVRIAVKYVEARDD